MHTFSFNSADIPSASGCLICPFFIRTAQLVQQPAIQGFKEPKSIRKLAEASKTEQQTSTSDGYRSSREKKYHRCIAQSRQTLLQYVSNKKLETTWKNHIIFVVCSPLEVKNFNFLPVQSSHLYLYLNNTQGKKWNLSSPKAISNRRRTKRCDGFINHRIL